MRGIIGNVVIATMGVQTTIRSAATTGGAILARSVITATMEWTARAARNAHLYMKVRAARAGWAGWLGGLARQVTSLSGHHEHVGKGWKIHTLISADNIAFGMLHMIRGAGRPVLRTLVVICVYKISDVPRGTGDLWALDTAGRTQVDVCFLPTHRRWGTEYL